MTRERAQQIAVYWANEGCEKFGENYPFTKRERRGKNMWTWGEYRTAAINDECMEELYNPVNGVLQLEEEYNRHGESLEGSEYIKIIK